MGPRFYGSLGPMETTDKTMVYLLSLSEDYLTTEKSVLEKTPDFQRHIGRARPVRAGGAKGSSHSTDGYVYSVYIKECLYTD